jgi:hypothetical protein
MPLVKLVAEAGWEPITRARSSDEHVYIERFGRQYLTVFNDSDKPKSVTLSIEEETPVVSHELVHGQTLKWHNRQTTLTLDGEDVAVIKIE